MIALALALVCVPSSTVTPMLEDGAPIARVENRRFTKDDRVLTRVGFAWWSRDDLRVNPGIAIEGTWYLTEQLGLDLVSATVYFSTLSASADALRRQTGLLPDSQRPLVRAMAGARWSFAYGKVLLESLGVIVHLDVAARAHVGLVITEKAPNPGGDLGLAVQARAGDLVSIWIDGGWLATYESRQSASFASGLSLAVGVGLLW